MGKKQWAKGNKGNDKKNAPKLFTSLEEMGEYLQPINIDILAEAGESSMEDQVYAIATKLVNELDEKLSWIDLSESTITKSVDKVAIASIDKLIQTSTPEEIEGVVRLEFELKAAHDMLLHALDIKKAVHINSIEEILKKDTLSKEELKGHVVEMKDVEKVANKFAKYINSIVKDVPVKAVADAVVDFMISHKVFAFKEDLDLSELHVELARIVMGCKVNKRTTEFMASLNNTVTPELLFQIGMDKKKDDKVVLADKKQEVITDDNRHKIMENGARHDRKSNVAVIPECDWLSIPVFA